MYIYVADFVNDRTLVPVKYSVPYSARNFWFNASSLGIKKIRAGEILGIEVPGGYHAYVVASKNYTIGEVSDVDALRLPTIDASTPRVNIEKFGCKDGVNIWDSCVPDDNSATMPPWSFKIEGITNQYISLVWKDRYNEAGTFTLTVLNTPENRALFKEDRYISTSRSKKIMIIEKVKANKFLSKNTDFLEVTGRSLESILDRRVAFPGMGLNTIEDKGQNGLVNALYRVIDNYFVHPENLAKKSSDGNKTLYYPDRKMTFLNQSYVVEHKDEYIRRTFDAQINTTISKEDILKVVTKYCAEYDLGFEVIAQPRYGNSYAYEWVIRFYTGHDKSYDRPDKLEPPLILSPKLRNVNSIASTVDMTNYKNSVFCIQEKETTTYIDLSQANEINLGSGLVGTIAKNLITSIREKFVDNAVSFTVGLILAVAANRRDRGYTFSVTDIIIEDEPEPYAKVFEYWNHSKDSNGNFRINYPTGPISQAEAELITIKYKQSFGSDIGSSKTGTFKLSNISDFLSSTAFGWLTPVILTEATAAANALDESNWNTSSIPFISKLPKKAITGLFSLMSTFTSSATLNEWLCETYDRQDDINKKGGLNRREVIVEKSDKEDADWDTSASNAWANQTTLVKETTVKDEESDEEISKKLRESARKGVGKYSKKHEVDIDIDHLKLEYGVHYELGDILQVDDNSGETSKVIVTEVEYDDDQRNPNKTIPVFKKYSSIPSAYVKLESLTFAQMLLPAIFDEEDAIVRTTEDLMGRYGSAVEPEYGKDNGKYDGFITSVMYERSKKWTELELEASYEVNTDIEGNQLNPSFALLSAVGFRVKAPYMGEVVPRWIHVGAPLCLVTTALKKPLLTGLTGLGYEFVRSRFSGERIGLNSSRDLIIFLGDEAKRTSNDLSNVWSKLPTYSPGFSIKTSSLFTPDLSNPDKYLGYIHKYSDSGLSQIFHINAPSKQSDGTFMSKTYVGDASHVLMERPQYSRKYRYDPEHNLYLQDSSYSAYREDDNEYRINPWWGLNRYKNINGIITPDACLLSYTRDLTNFEDRGLILTEGGTKANQEGETSGMRFATNERLEHLGAYGQVPTSRMHSNDIGGSLEVSNMGKYRFITLGGQAVVNFTLEQGSDWETIPPDNEKGLEWPNMSKEYVESGVSKIESISLNDPKNGITFKKLDVYEYDSSYKVYRWGDERISNDPDNPDPIEIDGENTDLLDDIAGSQNIEYKSKTIGGRKFYIEAAFEEPILETKRLVHRYKPVRYNAEGSDDLKDVEKYGLFDEVEMTFIPLNYNPFRNVAGLTGDNTNATFIRSGGELVNE